MPAINISSYFSQWDGDSGGAKGACGETCLKMIDTYLTGRQVPISAIIQNGDGDPNITTLAGMQKAADWLGFGVTYYYETLESDLRQWLNEGRLIVAVLKYDFLPAKYKQDLNYNSGHFVLVTGITDDGQSIRYADPNFWGMRREEGWMNNNKWATYGDFYLAFYHNAPSISRNGTVLVSKKVKEQAPPLPMPPSNPCEQIEIERDTLRTRVQVLEKQLADKDVAMNNYRLKVKQLANELGKL
jgi:hypothetical protein